VLASQVSVLNSKAEGFAGQIENLEESLKDAIAKIAQLSAEQEQIQPTASSTSDEELRVAYEKSQVAESAQRAKLDAAREALHSAERERDAVAAKHAALGMTLEQKDGSSEVRNAQLAGIKGLLAESVSIEKGYEVAVAVALGTLSDAIVATTREQAVAALRYLKSEGLGRAEFLVVQGAAVPAKKREVSGLVAADSVVTAPQAVLDVLSGFYFAQDLDQAAKALDSKDLSGANIITIEGDWVSKSLIRGGGSKQPSKLELRAELDFAAKRLSELAANIEKLTQDLDGQKNALLTAETKVRESLSSLQQHDAELAARAERVGRIIAQVDSAKNEKLRIERELATLAEAEQKAKQEALEAANKLSAMPETETVAGNESQRSELVAVLEAARQSELDVRINVGTFSERRISASKAVAILRGRLSEATAAQERERKATEEKIAQLANAEQALAAIPAALDAATRLANQVRSQVRELEAQRIQRTERLTQLRAQAATLEARFSELNQGVHEVEMQNHELRLNLANLTERVSTELHIDVETLIQETELEGESKEELEKAVRQAEQKLSQLGAFNPLALEEFAALEERHKYMSEQLEDLTKARADLMGIIKDLDQKMQSIFASAFEDTRREFEKVFPVLFPGGTGSISLTEPDDLLATGIEVAVRPVGKRIERMSLLSGGERSLAAVALLIAIFKARPSPFYVLDEVEAALDDANLGRLLEVIESLRKSSQLIIVTHQKRTMEIADALYGVSMRQDGMSAVVGQKLEKAR
jgi:chromosome segregation protein